MTAALVDSAPAPEDLITRDQAASRRGVALITIDRAIRKGLLNRHRQGDRKHVWLDVREVDRLPVWRPVTGVRDFADN